MESRDIKSLDCSRMIINPLHPKLVGFLEDNIPSIKKLPIEYKPKVFTKASVYRYVLLQYDPESDIQKMHSLDWYNKKFMSCQYAGFKLQKGRDGHMRFDECVLDMILGKNNHINDIIVEFLSWLNNSQWEYLVFLKEAMNGMTRDSLGGKVTQHKSSQDYIKLYNDYRKASNELAHTHEETKEFINRFYYHIEKSRLAITCEDYAEALSNGEDLRGDSPYGVGYVVDPLKFAGDHIPNE